jgi:hypothetical protein
MDIHLQYLSNILLKSRKVWERKLRYISANKCLGQVSAALQRVSSDWFVIFIQGRRVKDILVKRVVSAGSTPNRL